MLRDPKEEEILEEGLVRRVETITTTIGSEGDRDPPSQVEMEMLDGMGHLGSEEGLDDDMNFSIRRLFAEYDVFKGINDIPP